MPRLPLTLAAGWLAAVAPASAQPNIPAPPPPERYDAEIRYRIDAGRDERVRQFRAMTAFLLAQGFAPAEREDADLDAVDPTAERLLGSVPSATADRLLDEPRVRAVLFRPAGSAPIDDATATVPVRVELTRGLGLVEQKLLHDQVVAQLRLQGFAENLGYDTAGYGLVRGRMPAGRVDGLLRDLRHQGGWFLPARPLDFLPLPLRNTSPIRRIEVVGAPVAPPAPDPAAEPAENASALAKVTDDLKAVLADAERQGNPLRVEMILDSEPVGGPRELEPLVQSVADGAVADGLIGVVVSVRLARASDAAKLAELPPVRGVRLPATATATVRRLDGNALGVTPADQLLRTSGVATLHALGYRGKGARVAVLAADFAGAAERIGTALPASTRRLDLTAELDPALRPAPAGEGAGGTAAALVAHAAAPEAEIVLVRIDPAALHQALSVARAVSGDSAYSAALQVRSRELVRQGDVLSARRTAVLAEYSQAFASLSDEEGPARRRRDAADALNTLLNDEAEFKGAVDRYAALKAGLDALADTTVVINTLVWETGYAQDGLSELSRFLEANFAAKPSRRGTRLAPTPPTPAWVQAASPSLGQVWAGPLTDADQNGAAEFAPDVATLPANRWTRELNFLRFAPADGAPTATLPAGLKVRVAVQWREPRDPIDAGVYEPANPLTLRLLRQVDPEGKSAPADDMVEVAQASGPALQLQRTATSGTYELTLQAALPADGIYAVRLDRGPTRQPSLGAMRSADLRPRVAVTVADAGPNPGRVLFETFAPASAGVGIPGDSPAALTVGTASALTGAGPGAALRIKPDLVTAERIGTGDDAADGPGAAAAFVGGAGASLRGAGVRPADLIRGVGLTEGGPFGLPEAWLKNLRTVRRAFGER